MENFKLGWEDVPDIILNLFLVTSIMLSYMIGRYETAHGMAALLNFSCDCWSGVEWSIDPSSGSVIINQTIGISDVRPDYYWNGTHLLPDYGENMTTGTTTVG